MGSEADVQELLTVQEAANMLGVRDSTMRSALLQGRLSFTMVEGRKMIKRQDLIEYQARTQPDGVSRIGRRKGSFNSKSRTSLGSLE